MLTRARGGLLLDEAGETAHLIALCRRHHNVAHSPEGYEAGLMIDGYVMHEDGKLVYDGSDPRLTKYRRPTHRESDEVDRGPEQG